MKARFLKIIAKSGVVLKTKKKGSKYKHILILLFRQKKKKNSFLGRELSEGWFGPLISHTWWKIIVIIKIFFSLFL